ncbi:glycosyltransferase family 4 protein [Salinimicrobium tongyeongense]|uniref:Glycosyltransferase family 4 protein n=2 Tax=Salinimicrobium tongyeongense TaxID=2809707 RepID=A0ABY6NUZ5_9FLAO|nr:glycosyltransferase family 4 protein [Salinimicrobium tongyeongense]
MISMSSSHFFRWTEQLKNSGHQVHWIDVFDSNTYVEKIDFVHQTIGWRNKIKYPGRYKLKEKLPWLDKLVNKFNQRKLETVVERKLNEIQPDAVHSFVMYSACVPILKVMRKNPAIKWIYSAWGNDLYFYQNRPHYLSNIKEVLPVLDFMFADCKRDYFIAQKHGFKKEYLGTFPTGGGYDLKRYEQFVKPWDERKIILVKGYQHQFGRCNAVLQALLAIREEIKDFKVVVFAANEKVKEYVARPEFKNFKNLEIKGFVNPGEVMKLMGESVLYIGNSISDGTPNTLLEAIIMEAFPIQSDPGGATSETITHNFNGLLIKDPEDPSAIASTVKTALNNPAMMEKGIEYNRMNIKPQLEREYLRSRVLKAYGLVEKSLKN